MNIVKDISDIYGDFMKLVIANGKQILKMTRIEWEKLGSEKGWVKAEDKKSPKEHGFIEQCIEENSDKKDPGAYYASIVDKVKGTTDWRKGTKKD